MVPRWHMADQPHREWGPIPPSGREQVQAAAWSHACDNQVIHDGFLQGCSDAPRRLLPRFRPSPASFKGRLLLDDPMARAHLVSETVTPTWGRAQAMMGPCDGPPDGMWLISPTAGWGPLLRSSKGQV